MKTKYLSSVLIAAFSILFAACSSDRDDNPKLGPNHTATDFVVNTSAVADQYIQLSPVNNVNLTWSQPNYGVNTVVNYKVQVGLVENGSVNWSDEYLETSYTSCNVQLSGEEIAKAICKLDGFKTEDDYVDMGFRKIAMRVAANIQTTTSQLVEGTEIMSNVVSFKHMAAYCNIPTKAKLFIIGSCCNWPEPVASQKQKLIDDGWFVEETEIGSNKYHGVVEMPAGDLTFRFYSKLTGWGSDDNPEGSIGQQAKDEAKEFTLPHSGTCMPGKGSWTFTGFPGGKLEITVDLGNNTVSFVLQ